MKGQKFNKQVVTTLRFIYRMGLIKTLLLSISIFAAAEEYKARWKGRHVHLRKGTTDFCVFRQVLAFEQYNIKALKPERVNVIVDLGANIGLSVIYFKNRYPQAQIIAVEPEKANYDLLVKNVAGLPAVHCMNNAIWHSHKNLGVFDNGGGAYSYQVKEESKEEKAVVQSVTINDIIEIYQLRKIDLLKIDIEGSEKELFSDNYAWLHKVGCIVIEVHDWFRPGCAAAFFRAISNMDYTLSFKGENITILFGDTGQHSPADKIAIEENKSNGTIGDHYNYRAEQ
ncbi:FkbM family methyltransferase [Pseudoflavitalea sp. X16]|uniref:FkbM family methyltransferase n=1 Tax=Paraflavitalea devenefica TaxID=2716334 RepID=UPI0014249716|nr:FkbM family methyltransferase [Paraflavitalea devenefica]NII27396.1 FkbM family methyltransferase [Paraflavitalea devenefica]